MPRLAKKNAATKVQASGGTPVEGATESAAGGQPVEPAAEPRTPTQSPTRPHIGYFGRSSCPCWRCVRNMGPLQRRKEVVEQDISDILLDSWHSSAPEGADVSLSNYAVHAKALIDASDQQELNDLEAAFAVVEAEYDEQTLGDVADRILLYAVQKGWGAACKVPFLFFYCLEYGPPHAVRLQWQEIEYVQLCVKFKADVNAQDDDNGGTPLMYAIHNAHDRIVETLISLKADMEHEEQQGYTPLMVACLSDNATACELLLKNNAELDNTDSKGRTALSMACRYGSLECVKVLTSYGANVSHRDEDGMSVLEHAEQNDRRQVVGLIKRAQLANQMRQRRKHKHQNKDNGMTQAEFEERNERAQEQMDELLQEIEQEAEGAEARRARQRARRNARKNEKKVAKRKENGNEVATEETNHHVRQKGGPNGNENGCAKANGAEHRSSHAEPETPEPEQRDRFGCTAHEAAELNAFRRVLLEGRVSPEEAVWQWCTGEDALDIQPDQLRKMWDFMVDAASQCREAEHHATFLTVISVLYEVCSNHNIGVKQGKKVKARLEKVGPLRAQLVDAMNPPVDEGELEAVLDAIRSVELMLDMQLLERARAVQKTLQEGGPGADALRASKPAVAKIEPAIEDALRVSVEAHVHPVHAAPLHPPAVAMQQQLSLADATPPPPPPPPRVAAPYGGRDVSRNAGAPVALAKQSPPRMAGGHAASAPPPPGMHIHPAARPTTMQPPRIPGAPAPPPLRIRPQHGVDQAPSRPAIPSPPALAPAASHVHSPANPFAGTSAHMADPMEDLLGSDLVGAMDNAGISMAGPDMGQQQNGWPPASGPPMPGNPIQAHGSPMQLPGQVRMQQHGSPGMRPFGSNGAGMFRGSVPTNGAVSRPLPPGPPPVPPPAPGVLDSYGGPKPPGIQRNGVKLHHSPGQNPQQAYGGAYSSGMHAFDGKPEPPIHQPTHSAPFMAMNQQQQRIGRDAAGRFKEQGLHFGQLSTRAAPFMPASKGRSSPQLPVAPVGRGLKMHAQMFQKVAGASGEGYHGSVGTLPAATDHFMSDLPSDPFGLDGPLPNGNEVHQQCHARRDLTSDAVTSVLEGHANRAKHEMPFSSGTVHATFPVQTTVQSAEVLNWLGNDILDALDDNLS